MFVGNILRFLSSTRIGLTWWICLFKKYELFIPCLFYTLFRLFNSYP